MSYWTSEELSYISTAPFPADKEEIIDWGMRESWPGGLLQNLSEELEDGIEYDLEYFLGDDHEDPDFDEQEDEY